MPETFTARPHILHEANLRQLRALKPNVAVLPWGATEGHNYHLPHGTDVIEGTRMGEDAVTLANEQGARCLLLPTVPFGIDNQQLANQVATITMRARTQYLVLHDVAESLVRQGIDRLLVLNFHGGNEFKSMIRDVMLDLPIFIVQAHGFQVAPQVLDMMAIDWPDHACEFETSLMMHIKPEWVAPLSTAGPGKRTPSKLPTMSSTPGVWSPRDWATLTEDTGSGSPQDATLEKGQKMWQALVDGLVPVLVELSKAKRGDFPFIVRGGPVKAEGPGD